jgi:hypothetical protein
MRLETISLCGTKEDTEMNMQRLTEKPFDHCGIMVSKDFEALRGLPAYKEIMAHYYTLLPKRFYVMRTCPVLTVDDTAYGPVWSARMYMNDFRAWCYCGWTPEAAVVATLTRIIADHA